MNQLIKPAAIALFMVTAHIVSSFTFFNSVSTDKPVNTKVNQRIQVAILLDVSGSMDGLIEQAKAQLWNMVSTLGKAKCDGDIAPKIEIALYEYGRSSNPVKDGYVKQVNGFISDLDSLSQNLFSLKTNGGDEYCGQVIFNSLDQLKWAAEESLPAGQASYKVIFIAGNEDFLQGNLHYTKACSLAKQKGVIVNTIYCGDKMQGIRENWNLAGECGNGSYTHINQNSKEEEIPTPYDSLIYSLNHTLNGTYISYGYGGAAYKAKQAEMDNANASMSKAAGIKRINAKSNGVIYNNAGWDLVDAKGTGAVDLAKIDKKELPDSLKNKTTAELEKIVSEKSKERSAVQQEIASLNSKRNAFIAAEKVKRASNKNNEATLETEVEKIIREQAKRYNMVIQ
jgi:hypothetical protein